MDQNKFKTLREIVGKEDQNKLIVLHDAVVSGLENYRAEKTSARLMDWQRAERALDEFILLLWSQYFQQEKTLANPQKVARYLSAQGWKVSRQTVQRHKKEGKIIPQADRSFRISDIEKYADTYLQRLDGSQTGKGDHLQREKLIAETRKSIAQAEHWEKKTQVFSGDLVPKDWFECELAKRAAFLRSDLESFVRTNAAGIINLVGGDAGKISDLINLMLSDLSENIDRYAEEKVFTIPAPMVATKDPNTDIGDDDLEEE